MVVHLAFRGRQGSGLSDRTCGSAGCVITPSQISDVSESPVASGVLRAGKRHRGDVITSDLDSTGAVVQPLYYEIRIAGLLPPEALLDFERLTASVEPVETVLHGPISDQAALNGLLARLELIGVQVLEIRRIRQRDPPAGGSAGAE
jgi:hypothetical protein